ncbi:MAG: recombination regulator RecX [Endomicrobium sp.]|jgi:regulatory protein|nr:recombination regulator RecX [Endomicrobium sp.]
MKIEKIEKIKFKKNMFKVFFENSGSLVVFADSIVKFGIRTGIDIPENDYKELASYDKLKRATSDALVLVSKRSYSAKSLHAKLLQKGYETENAIKAVEKLKELNYINDKKFAKTYADYLSQKGKGEFAIRAELEKQGIEKILINETLEIIKTDIEPHEQIINILKIKFEKFSGKDENETRRIASFFLRRGFSYQDIAKAFRACSR